MNWPFDPIRPLSAGVLLVDPPWRYANWSKKGEHKGAVAQYDVMDLTAIKALPVGQLSAPDCALIMWATAPLLSEAIETMRAWGFTFKSAGAWAKQSSTVAKWAFDTRLLLPQRRRVLPAGHHRQAAPKGAQRPQPRRWSSSRAFSKTRPDTVLH
jgi:hypothetical protein